MRCDGAIAEAQHDLEIFRTDEDVKGTIKAIMPVESRWGMLELGDPAGQIRMSAESQ